MSEIFFDTIIQYESRFEKRMKKERPKRGRVTRKLIKQGMNNYQIAKRLRTEGLMVPTARQDSIINHYRWKMGNGE